MNAKQSREFLRLVMGWVRRPTHPYMRIGRMRDLDGYDQMQKGDVAVIAQARRLLADGRHGESARQILLNRYVTMWLQHRDHPLMCQPIGADDPAFIKLLGEDRAKAIALLTARLIARSDPL